MCARLDPVGAQTSNKKKPAISLAHQVQSKYWVTRVRARRDTKFMSD